MGSEVMWKHRGYNNLPSAIPRSLLLGNKAPGAWWSRAPPAGAGAVPRQRTAEPTESGVERSSWSLTRMLGSLAKRALSTPVLPRYQQNDPPTSSFHVT